MQMTVTIAGSYRKHLGGLLRAREAFVALGCRVVRPVSDEVVSQEGAFVRLEGDPSHPEKAAASQLAAIRSSELLYLVNPGGYIGASAMLEIGYAAALGVPVISSERAFEPAACAQITASLTPEQASGRVGAMLLPDADRRLLVDVLSDRVLNQRSARTLTAHRADEGIVISRADPQMRPVARVRHGALIDCVDPLLGAIIANIGTGAREAP